MPSENSLLNANWYRVFGAPIKPIPFTQAEQCPPGSLAATALFDFIEPEFFQSGRVQ